MKYKTIASTRIAQVDLQVDEAILDGWKLYGDPYVYVNLHCQAMTRGEYPRPGRTKARIEKKAGV